MHFFTFLLACEKARCKAGKKFNERSMNLPAKWESERESAIEANGTRGSL